MAFKINPLGMFLPVVIQLGISLFANVDGNYGYNAIVFALLLVAYYLEPKPEPVLTALVLLSASILIDIITLGVYAHGRATLKHSNSGLKQKYIDTTKFALAMTIINFIIKPFTAYVTYLEFRQRGGDVMTTLRGETAYASVEDHAEPYHGNASAVPGYSVEPQDSTGGYQGSSPAVGDKDSQAYSIPPAAQPRRAKRKDQWEEFVSPSQAQQTVSHSQNELQANHNRQTVTPRDNVAMNERDETQLYNACIQSDAQEALQLLNSWTGQRIRDAAAYRDGDGDTPLHHACHRGLVGVVEMLLKHRVDAEAQNINGSTPLHIACQEGHKDAVQVLLDYGVGTEARHRTTASVVAAVDTWLKPLLPGRNSDHPLPHLKAFINGAINHDPELATTVDDIQKTMDEAPPEFPAIDWPAFENITTQALGALDQALEAPEALNNYLGQLNPDEKTLGSVLQELQDIAGRFELQPILLELQAKLAVCPVPPTTPATVPEAPPKDLKAALDKFAELHDIGPRRRNLLITTNTNLKHLMLGLIDALDAVAGAGTNDTIHRVNTLRQSVECLDVRAPPPAETLPNSWEQLRQAHKRLSLSELNGLKELRNWRAEHNPEHHDWYLAFVLHESQALVQQLQDMIDWQATTLSVLTSCKIYADGISQNSADQVVSIHEEVVELQENIQATTAFLPLASDEMRAGLEDRLQKMKERLVILQQQLSDQTQVDQVAALAGLLYRHFPALLVFLRPEQSALGARLRTVLGPDLPASLILEAMTEVDRALSLSTLGHLNLHYNQNHKVYKARAALPNHPEQDLAVKEYAFACQQKKDRCRTFLRELRAMRKLEHPHIIPVLGALVDVKDGQPSAYLVQPWCTQGDLQQWLGEARQLATSEVIAGLMAQLRTALAFMHSKGLVHRDVKLSNVMLDGDQDQPVVRLGDFDIAKAAAETTMLPCTATSSSGTAGYVPPEVLFGGGRVGARPAQDAFSFGCVLYNTYMYPLTVPPAKISPANPWMCDSTSDLYKETRALLATDPKQRPSLLGAAQNAQRPGGVQVGPAIDVLRNAPELISEVADLLKQLSTDEQGLPNIAVQRVERVQNPVLWERYSAKRREMLHCTTSQEHYDGLLTAKVDELSGCPALLRDTCCQERLLFHGIPHDKLLRDKIVRLGLDYRFAGSSAGHRFGLGVYAADHPGKPEPNGEHMLIITRALLGHAFVNYSPPPGALAPPLLPNAPNNERYDSVIATPPGETHEVVIFDNAQIYPELVVYYNVQTFPLG
ncbi:uncharacterized protein MONBRDRAFT_38704 [Monosiga brevicollis MX1]|uniref:Protein kinase domain-containing protein n=1 Tax=Monosiga brevicollis TaxID=81824 RepID=A9V9M5_MONBE|nr:uncharacterized protein MONBRDRAFT_38704 [Monosiga brevicollis MX1]EDQ85695.1 predicted protein [Monosiga brevicollis MX1]|eukprot:XP_001749410.1 hypothetical protein [Monosiga brevicollis MX1]